MIVDRQIRSHLIVSLDRLLQIRDTKPSIDERNVRLRQKKKKKKDKEEKKGSHHAAGAFLT